MTMKNLVSVPTIREANNIQKDIVYKLTWLKAGIISYNLPLLSTLSAAENIMLPLCYSERMTRNEAEPIVLSLLEKFDLSFIMHYRPKKLNEYEILIVKFLRAIMRKPECVVFIMPNNMVPSEDYTTFKEFADSLKDFEVMIVEHQRYISEYLDTDFKEVYYKDWIKSMLSTKDK